MRKLLWLAACACVLAFGVQNAAAQYSPRMHAPIVDSLQFGSQAPVTGIGVTGNTLPAGNDRRFNGNMFWAPSYGSCVWDAAHDVGPCIIAAMSAAHAAGGGTVGIPYGIYGQATPIIQTYSGVNFIGMGVGDKRDTYAPNVFQSNTRLVWIGAAGATMFDQEPAAGANESLYSSSVEGIVFDCASVANICAKFAQSSHGTIKIGVSEPRLIGAYLTTTNISDAPGTQDNDVWIDSRSTNSAYSPTGILIDGGAGSNWNVSYNRFWRLSAWITKGDGVVFGYSDNNLIFDLNGTNSSTTGTTAVFAAPGYVMPNGMSVVAAPYTTRVFHDGAAATVQGSTQASTITASPSNIGNASVATITKATNAATVQGSAKLNFSSTTGLAPYMNVNCGGPGSGVANNNEISSVSEASLNLGYPATGNVAANTSCAFSYGMSFSAVPGTYTLTATGPTLFNITAPAGGNSQTGVALTNGILSFTDMTIPFSGTAAAGDSWTVTILQPPYSIVIEGVDKANAIPNPHYAPGAAGSYVPTSSVFPVQASGGAGIYVGYAQERCGSPTLGAAAVMIGDCGGGGASGQYSTVINGVGNGATGYGGTAVGGHNNQGQGTYAYAMGDGGTATGYAAFALGANVTAMGSTSWARGNSATDRGRSGLDVFSAGDFSTLGDAQIATSVMRGSATLSTSTTISVPVTADGTTASTANTNNLTANGLHYHAEVSGSCTDTSSASHIWASWDGAWGDADRKNGTITWAGAYASAVASSRTDGTSNWSGATLQVTANVSYGLTANFTLPKASGTPSAADTVHCAATMRNAQELQ